MLERFVAPDESVFYSVGFYDDDEWGPDLIGRNP